MDARKTIWCLHPQRVMKTFTQKVINILEEAAETGESLNVAGSHGKLVDKHWEKKLTAFPVNKEPATIGTPSLALLPVRRDQVQAGGQGLDNDHLSKHRHQECKP